MTPTSDERREVAERLRAYTHDFDFRDANPIWYVAKALFGDVDAHDYQSVFAGLADLIEPQKSEEEKDHLIVDALDLLDTIYSDYRNLRRSVVYEPEDVWCYGKAEDELLMEGRKRIKALKKRALSLGIASDEDDGFYEL